MPRSRVALSSGTTRGDEPGTDRRRSTSSPADHGRRLHGPRARPVPLTEYLEATIAETGLPDEHDAPGVLKWTQNDIATLLGLYEPNRGGEQDPELNTRGPSFAQMVAGGGIRTHDLRVMSNLTDVHCVRLRPSGAPEFAAIVQLVSLRPWSAPEFAPTGDNCGDNPRDHRASAHDRSRPRPPSESATSAQARQTERIPGVQNAGSLRAR